MKHIIFAIIVFSVQLAFAKCPNYWGRYSKKIDFKLDLKAISIESAAKSVSDIDFRKDLVKSNNDCGNISWFQSHILSGLLEMYEATKDHNYLDKFIKLADDIESKNDIYTNKYDKLRKRVVYGWSSTKYTKFKERHVMGVESAVISLPYAKFANLILKERLSQYFQKAFKYQEVATRAMREIEEDWNEKIGFYKFKPRAHKKYSIYPYNQGLAIGSVYLELYEINLRDNEHHLAGSYQQRVLQIGNYFRKALSIDKKNKRLLWRYAPDAYFEDTSHASIDFDFIISAHEKDLLFTKKELKLFVKTIAKAFGDNKLARYIDGKNLKGYTSWHGLTCLRLMRIAKYSRNKMKLINKCKDSVKEIILNENIIKAMPYQFYTMLPLGLTVIYRESID